MASLAWEVKPETVGSRSTGKLWADIMDTPQDSQESLQGQAEMTADAYHSSAAAAWINYGPQAASNGASTAGSAGFRTLVNDGRAILLNYPS